MAVKLASGYPHVTDELTQRIHDASREVRAARARWNMATGAAQLVAQMELETAEARLSALLCESRGETYEGKKSAREIYEMRYGDGGAWELDGGDDA